MLRSGSTATSLHQGKRDEQPVDQTGLKHANTNHLARLSKPLYLEVKLKMSTSEILVIFSHFKGDNIAKSSARNVATAAICLM